MDEGIGFLKEPPHIISAVIELARRGEELAKAQRAYEEASKSVLPLLEAKEQAAKLVTDAAAVLWALRGNVRQ